MGRWRSWLSHLSNTQKVLSSSLGRLIWTLLVFGCVAFTVLSLQLEEYGSVTLELRVREV